MEEVGASTWGDSQEDALENIQEVLSMIFEEFNDQNRSVPGNQRMTVTDGAAVIVNL